jgi:hypothetical protein
MVEVNRSQIVVGGVRKVDIAGSQWPVYKIEALAVGVLAGLVLVLVTGSLQVAVLAAAALATLRWAAAAVLPLIRLVR